MADLSLGPLKIANPDADDDASPDFTMRPTSVNGSRSTISPSSPLTQDDHTLQQLSNKSSSVPPLGEPPRTSVQAAAAAVEVAARQQKSASLPRSQKPESIPYTFQDQQQAQFPQYPTMMPQILHDPQTNASRPVSNMYTQTPQPHPNGHSNGGGLARVSSYRMRTDASRQTASVPHRSTSRGSSATLQAGVPTRDGSHTERSYKQQYSPGNGPVPPRRTSKGVNSTRHGASPSNGNTLGKILSNTPQSSNTPLSSSPYSIEGGPLSSSEEWKEKGAAVGVQQDYDVDGKPVSRYIKKGVKDFNFGQTLGEGSYSTVLAATDRQTLRDYAIKVLDKRHIIKEKKVKYVNIEKDTLNRLTDHPGVVRLYYTFQDERSLYFVLDLASGGELLGVLKRMTTFDEECTRFYGAQILDTVEYMHKRGVIHRDLKPENVLLDDKMHVKITDFGTAKILDLNKADTGSRFEPDTILDDNRASSFVGTAEYVSPELLTDKNACKASDLWAFGCIVYQLLAGRPPFKAGNEYQTFQRIVALDYDFPRGFPDVARDLIERLLVLDPQRRLSIEHIKNHPFFDGITWGRGLWLQKAPRLKTYVPPAAAPIRLNAELSNGSYPIDITLSHSTAPTILPPNNNGSRSQPRVITQLPPPSQLDIEWSPVLTRNNERILKLGNMSVQSTPKAHNPHNGQGGGGKFSRLFGGSGAKKRQRLVMVTSSARIILAEAGGDEKKTKSEILLLHPDSRFSSSTDSKGITHWTVDTREKQYTFEDPNPPKNEPMATAQSTQEWLEELDRAKEFALSQRMNSSYNDADDSLNMSSSALSSHANTLDRSPDFDTSPAESTSHHRGTLHKQPSGNDTDSIKGRKRFSKRQSKSGLAAVF